jgi:UDP-galactopyranose mutase
MYDYLIVGSGFFGAVFARQMAETGKKVLIVEQRPHIGGNSYTEQWDGINVGIYGPHIFHTNNLNIWNYVNRFATFNHFVNRVKVNYKGEIYSFPINLMTLYQVFGVKTPTVAKSLMKHLTAGNKPGNDLESWAVSQIGWELYMMFIQGYTMKQWMKHPKELPATIIKRLPIRYNFEDNYYTHRYQGIPIGGYTQIFEKLLDGIEVKLNTSFDKKDMALAKKTLYTGRVDEFFDYQFGDLEYRSLRFEHEKVAGDFQGVAAMNYTEIEIPFTRIIEHKHFEFKELDHSIITREYPIAYDRSQVPYYPIADNKNMELHQKYMGLADSRQNVIFGGRLGMYRYFDMDQTIAASLQLVDHELNSA